MLWESWEGIAMWWVMNFRSASGERDTLLTRGNNIATWKEISGNPAQICYYAMK